MFQSHSRFKILKLQKKRQWSLSSLLVSQLPSFPTSDSVKVFSGKPADVFYVYIGI